MRDAFYKITNEIDTNSYVKCSQQRFDSIKWNQLYNSVIDYGFVAFGIIKNKNDTKSIFKIWIGLVVEIFCSKIGTTSLVKPRLVRKQGYAK